MPQPYKIKRWQKISSEVVERSDCRKGEVRRRDDGTYEMLVESRSYYINVPYRDAAGRKRWKRIRAYADKAASQKLLVERMAEFERGEAGLLDPFSRHRKRPLAEHLADFMRHLEARRTTEKYRRNRLTQLRTAFQMMKARFPGDLSTEKAEMMLVFMERELDLGAKTRNHYIAGLKQFGDWGVASERWPVNPFARLKTVRAEDDVRRWRRALTVDELRRLLEATPTAAADRLRARYKNARGVSIERRLAEGKERALIYKIAAFAGLRQNEIRTLSWKDIELDREPATLTVEARYAKARRTDTIPLHPELAEDLRAWREEVRLRRRCEGRTWSVNDEVVHVPSDMARHFKRDCEAAGIEVEDEAGRCVDFHSLRHTYATLLTLAGVPPRIAQSLSRHSDIGTTMRTYTHVSVANQAEWISRLPVAEVTAASAGEERVAMAAGGGVGHGDDGLIEVENRGSKNSTKNSTKNLSEGVIFETLPDGGDFKSAENGLKTAEFEGHKPCLVPPAGFKPATFCSGGKTPKVATPYQTSTCGELHNSRCPSRALSLHTVRQLPNRGHSVNIEDLSVNFHRHF